MEPATRIALEKLRKAAAKDAKKRRDSSPNLDISSILNLSSHMKHQMTIGERIFSENLNSTPISSPVCQSICKDLCKELDFTVNVINIEEKAKEDKKNWNFQEM